jgi:hypothetical protein
MIRRMLFAAAVAALAGLAPARQGGPLPRPRGPKR